MAVGTEGGRRAGLRGRWLTAIGVAGLGLLGLAYWMTYEPAPRVRVRWRPDVPAAQRAVLERTYLLVNGRDPFANGSMAYDLLDTSRSNIRALVEEPAVADTGDIDRDTFVVPFHTDYGDAWMWIAHRTPGFRDARVRATVIVALTIMAIGGFAQNGLRAWRAVRRAAGQHAERTV